MAAAQNHKRLPRYCFSTFLQIIISSKQGNVNERDSAAMISPITLRQHVTKIEMQKKASQNVTRFHKLQTQILSCHQLGMVFGIATI